MAKNEQILRLKFIELLLRERKGRGATFDEIEHYLEDKFSDKDLADELKFSKKTFERDKKAISEIMGVDISYSRKNNVYFISEDELEQSQDSVFDNLLLVQAYRDTRDRSDIMFFEERKSRGLQYLHGLVHAIMNRQRISLQYLNYADNMEKLKVLEPYALKEFRYRWYLLAKDSSHHDSEQIMKAYGLDRISELEIKNSTFSRKAFDAKKEYRDLFGIISSKEHQLEEIELKFDEHQGNYIKSLPLHHSQEIVKDDENGLHIRLTLYPTYDFKQEILSYGNRVRVLSPDSFKNEIKHEIQEILSFYA